MNKFIKTSGIFTGVFGIAFGIAFATQYRKPNKQNRNAQDNIGDTVIGGDKPVSDQQRVLNSLLEIKGFNLEGDMTMISKDDTTIGVNFAGQGDLSDLDNIKLKGNIDVNLNASHLKANFGYFDSEIFFDYNESYFRLETEKLLDFIKLLPTNYEIGINIPSEIENMDLGMIESYVEEMSEKQLTPDGKNYYFTLELGEEKKVPLYIITDLDLNFEGVRTGTIDYEGMIFKLNAKLERLESVDLVSPKYTTDYEKYQDFTPALKLFDGIYALTHQKQNTINADLKVRKYSTVEGVQTSKDILKTNLDITYDLTSEDRLFGLEGKIIGEREDANNNLVVTEVPYNFALYQETIYAHYGSVAISAKIDSLTLMLDYILDKIGDEKITSLLDSFTSTMSTSQITDIVSKANDLLGTIVLTGDELGINLNTSNFSTTEVNEETGEEVDKLKLTNAYVAIKFNSNNGALESISLKNFGINDYEADLVLTFGEYKAFVLDNVNYQSVDHLVPLVCLYDLYKDMNKFRIEFDANISKDDTVDENSVVTSYNDITVDGGLQFELDPLRKEEGHVNVGYGYGDLSITDRKNVKHNIKADMKNVDEVLMSYSTVIGDATRDANTDPMNVKMKVQTLKDLVDLISTLVKNPDDHLNEILGKVMDQTATMPIQEIIGGDYLQILTTNLIDRLEIGDNYVEIDIALDVLAMAGTSFTVRIEFAQDNEGTFSGLQALKIKNLEFNGLHIEFNAYLKDFDENLESSRLSPAEDYIDFSDLKVLLELGINTSKNNYYHFTANAELVFSIIFDFDMTLPIDVKVWTNHGDVKVSIDITNIPKIPVASRNLTAKDMVSHIYYHDGVFFVNRTETYSKLEWFKIKQHKIEQASKYHTQEFFDNILQILCYDCLGLSDTVLNAINNSVNKNSENYQMKYENILNDFIYSPTGHYFYFDINLAEIANNSQLGNLTLKVLTDDSNTVLTGLNAHLAISLTDAIGLNITLKLQLADSSLVADDSNNLVALDEFEARMASLDFGRNEDTDITL